jgi:long-subunit fatty acid transport protein
MIRTERPAAAKRSTQRVAAPTDVKIPSLACASALAAFGALAGGIDQSGQPVTLIFKEGNYAEFAGYYGMPTVEGVDPLGNRSGNVYGSVASFGGGLKRQLGEAWALGLIVDQPYGVIVDYPASDFPYAGTSAKPKSLGVTALVRYRIDERFSLHGGLRATRFGADVRLAGPGFGPLAGYDWNGENDWGLGFVVGGTFEVPEIALRVALTYGSATEHELASTERLLGMEVRSSTEIIMPQSVNLDFQTGVAPRTLVFGSVRWVNWAGWQAAPQAFTAAAGEPLVEFENDAFTYRLGIGRQITDRFSAAVEVSHETARGQMMSALDPYDGYTAVGLGGTYEMPSGLSLTGGVAYNFLGDADVATPAGPAPFRDNRAVALALKVGFRF